MTSNYCDTQRQILFWWLTHQSATVQWLRKLGGQRQNVGRFQEGRSEVASRPLPADGVDRKGEGAWQLDFDIC